MQGFVFIAIIHLVKVILNWKTYNALHASDPIKMRPHYSGMWRRENAKGIQEISDSNFMFMYCMVVLFWIKIPKSKTKRIMAWSVLALTVLQIVIGFSTDWSKT